MNLILNQFDSNAFVMVNVAVMEVQVIVPPDVIFSVAVSAATNLLQLFHLAIQQYDYWDRSQLKI